MSMGGRGGPYFGFYKVGRYADSNLMRGVFTNNYLKYNIAVRYHLK